MLRVAAISPRAIGADEAASWERLLRQEVRDQVGADVDVEEEMRKLL